MVLVHRPTGIRVRIEGRSQPANRRTAMDVMRARVAAMGQAREQESYNAERQRQVGSGMRGDKVRTVRVRHRTVVDHRSGRTTSYRRYRRGYISDLR